MVSIPETASGPGEKSARQDCVPVRFEFVTHGESWKVFAPRCHLLLERLSGGDKKKCVLQNDEFKLDRDHELRLGSFHLPKRAVILLALSTFLFKRCEAAPWAGGHRSLSSSEGEERLDARGWAGGPNSYAFRLYEALRKNSGPDWAHDLFGTARPSVTKTGIENRETFPVLLRSEAASPYGKPVFDHLKTKREKTDYFEIGFTDELALSFRIDGADPSVEEVDNIFNRLLECWKVPLQWSEARSTLTKSVSGPPRHKSALPTDAQKFFEQCEGLKRHWSDLTNPTKSEVEDVLYTDTPRLIVPAYQAGQCATHKSFKTTSTFRSWLWTSSEQEQVQDSNRQLGERFQSLRSEGKGDGLVNQRLFITPEPFETMLKMRFAEMYSLSRLNPPDRFTREQTLLNDLDEKMKELKMLGCEVRVTCSLEHQAESFSKKLPEPWFQPGRTELALYDDTRIDFFGTSDGSPLTDLTIVLPGHPAFRLALKAAEEYWKHHWEVAQPFEVYIEMLREEDAKAHGHIAYDDDPVNWIEKYHRHPDDHDLQIKEEEKTALLKWGGEFTGGAKPFVRTLDVGSNTARIPGIIRDWVREDGKILGIDILEPFVHYAREQLRRSDATARDGRISIEQHDFLDRTDELVRRGKFDLITCMMGTVVHFAYSQKALERAADRFKKLLAKPGVLVLSSWRKDCRDDELLSTYSRDKKRKILELTPSHEDIQSTFSKAGLAVKKVIPAGSLQLYVIEHGSGFNPTTAA